MYVFLDVYIQNTNKYILSILFLFIVTLLLLISCWNSGTLIFMKKNQPLIVQHNEPQYISFVGDIIQSEALYLLYPFNWF